MNPEKLKQLIVKAKEAIDREATEGCRVGSLLRIRDFPIAVVGDLHGDYASLETIIKRLECEEGWRRIVFLGDYADRGPSPLDVYEMIFEMKSSCPDEIFLLRGNHEAADLIEFYPHELPWHIRNVYGNDWKEVYESIAEVHENLPIAVLLEGNSLMLHGGVSPEITMKNLEDPTNEDLETVLWSDPSENVRGTIPSNRGAGVLFGPDVSLKILDRFGVRYLIRGHSPTEKGFRWNHYGRVLTIFSAKHVYGLESGAYALIYSKEPLIEIRTF